MIDWLMGKLHRQDRPTEATDATDATMESEPTTVAGDLPVASEEDIQWARQQTVEIIRRARDLDIAFELEEMSR